MLIRNRILFSGIVLACAMTVTSHAALQQSPSSDVPLSENQKWEALEQYFNVELGMQLTKADGLGNVLRDHRWLQVVAMLGVGAVSFGSAVYCCGEYPENGTEAEEKAWSRRVSLSFVLTILAQVGISTLYNRLADKPKPTQQKCLNALTTFIQAWPQQRAITPEALCGCFDFLRKRWDVAPNLAFGNAQSAQLIIESIANFINANKLC